MTDPIPLVSFITGTDSDGRVVREAAAAEGWDFERTRTVRLASGRGRVAQVLPRRAAASLYEQLHRRRVAVVYDAKILVRTYPRPPFRDDRAVSLLEFCRYKAFLARHRTGGDEADWVEEFSAWCEAIECESPSDPRALPFHVFSAKDDYQLEDADERRRFKLDHRKRTVLIDQRRRSWRAARPNVRHGREPQQVAGYVLDQGFHWDVEAKKSPVVPSADVIWEVRRGGYLNIYADGCIRKGQECKLVWHKSDSDREDATEASRR